MSREAFDAWITEYIPELGEARGEAFPHSDAILVGVIAEASWEACEQHTQAEIEALRRGADRYRLLHEAAREEVFRLAERLRKLDPEFQSKMHLNAQLRRIVK